MVVPAYGRYLYYIILISQHQKRRNFLLAIPILSLSGIIFAIFSKKWSNIILGVLLNGAAGVFFTLLAFAVGFGEA